MGNEKKLWKAVFWYFWSLKKGWECYICGKCILEMLIFIVLVILAIINEGKAVLRDFGTLENANFVINVF